MTDKTIKLEGEGLALARKLVAETRAGAEAQNALQEEYQARARKLHEEAHATALAIWNQLHVATGLPLNEVGRWGLVGRYVEEHGIAFLEKQGTCACGYNHGEDDETDDRMHATGYLADALKLGTKH